MAEEFKAITTQEEFDAAIQARLARERASVAKQYSDYEDLKKKVAAFDSAKKSTEEKFAEEMARMKEAIATADGKIRAYELGTLRAKVAAEVGLPSGLIDRLSGETEEDIRKDAKTLGEIISAQNRKDLPGFKQFEAGGDPKDAAYRTLLENLNKE